MEPAPGDGLEHGAAIRAEARRTVAHRHGEQGAHERVGGRAQRRAVEAPAADGPAGDVARADDEVRLLDRGEERGQRSRIVREVAVHAAHHVGAGLEGGAEAFGQ